MFKKLLIANRGEIAVRILRSCRELGIRTVTVHSEADVQAAHVRLADESYLLGPAPVAQSYLRADRILEIAREVGVDAIHPGYGLLSENPSFARACQDAGIVFIGPSPEAIARMGLKVQARAELESIGVPVVPGHGQALSGADEAREVAGRIGYPVMLKASAGGGGIGMERIDGPEALEKAFKLCQGRAKAYFGNGDLYLEKFLDQPRHIEIQVLADAHGGAWQLGERECSIQRRHQKVLEEAPSVALTPEVRARMGEVALRIVRHLGYVNAGTLEFLLDASGAFYFLEMNTRLQVEHPVTELVTGLDLVALQLRVAAGDRLDLGPAPHEPRGHAIEVRLTAEDPVTFLPAPGTLDEVRWPEGVRIDTWVESGTTLSPHYDPLVAKIIAHGTTREEAIRTLRTALGEVVVTGTRTNLTALMGILEDPEFQRGTYSTQFLATRRVAAGV